MSQPETGPPRPSKKRNDEVVTDRYWRSGHASFRGGVDGVWIEINVGIGKT